MMKRIIAVSIVLVLAIGCVFALAETAVTEPAAETVAEAAVEAAVEETEAPAAVEEAAEEAAEEPTVEPTPIPEGETRYVCAPSGLYIRAAADLEADIVATPDFNYELKVIGEEGKWSHVIFETNGRVFEGYCWTAYLSDHKIVVKPAAKPAVVEPNEDSEPGEGNKPL